MAFTRGGVQINPDNAMANAGVKQRARRNRRAGAGMKAYEGVKVTSVPFKVAKQRAKQLAPYAAPALAVGGIALSQLLRNKNR